MLCHILINHQRLYYLAKMNARGFQELKILKSFTKIKKLTASIIAPGDPGTILLVSEMNIPLFDRIPSLIFCNFFFLSHQGIDLGYSSGRRIQESPLYTYRNPFPIFCIFFSFPIRESIWDTQLEVPLNILEGFLIKNILLFWYFC